MMKMVKKMKVMIRQLAMLLVMTSFVFSSSAGLYRNPAYAACCGGCCDCADNIFTDAEEWAASIIDVNVDHFTELYLHYNYEGFAIEFWTESVLPGLMKMTEELSAVGMYQVEVIGSFMDAKQELETQRLLQTMKAEAHRDYHPSVGLCEFASYSKSLARSEASAEYGMIVMSKRSIDRQLGNANTSAMSGKDTDMAARIDAFLNDYCDPEDASGVLVTICPDAKSASAEAKARWNKDINYTKTVDIPLTIGADFSDAASTPDEQDILALSNNLYGNHVLFRPTPTSLAPQKDGRMTDMQRAYYDSRSIIAKYSVAENSYNAITALKSEGSEGSRKFIAALLEELGVADDEIEYMLGKNPSYYAQMEILTKKIYQNPNFYVNLYDKPANVERKGAAIEAISLMQKFDLFKSYLRTEATLSVLLELQVADAQGKLENLISMIPQ